MSENSSNKQKMLDNLLFTDLEDAADETITELANNLLNDERLKDIKTYFNNEDEIKRAKSRISKQKPTSSIIERFGDWWRNRGGIIEEIQPDDNFWTRTKKHFRNFMTRVGNIVLPNALTAGSGFVAATGLVFGAPLATIGLGVLGTACGLEFRKGTTKNSAMKDSLYHKKRLTELKNEANKIENTNSTEAKRNALKLIKCMYKCALTDEPLENQTLNETFNLIQEKCKITSKSSQEKEANNSLQTIKKNIRKGFGDLEMVNIDNFNPTIASKNTLNEEKQSQKHHQ